MKNNRKTFALSLRLVAMLLAVALLLPTGALPAFSAEETVWNKTAEAFQLKEGPQIIRIDADSNESGTAVRASFRHTAGFGQLADQYFAALRSDDALFAAALGAQPDDVSADIEVGVQLAYSFDGKTWVNDWDPDVGREDVAYYVRQAFDFDDDGFNEYDNMPACSASFDRFFESCSLFDGRSGILCPGYCNPPEGMTIRQALTTRNNAILQGRGEYTGTAYEKTDEDWFSGFAVDFNRHTLYVKARYRVYNRYEQCVGGEWQGTQTTVFLSDWGPVKTYNNKTASPEGQNCVPEASVLKNAAAPQLSIVSTERRTVERDGVDVKTSRFGLRVDYPAAVKTALAGVSALPGDDREELVGEYYEPHLYLEIRTGEGDWYYFENYSYNETCVYFDDDAYWTRDILEEIGYQPGDTVYVRARLVGSDSGSTAKNEGDKREKLYRDSPWFIWSEASAPVELSLSGKYKIEYALGGGSFPYGTTQVGMFDEDSLFKVDLTAPDYTPEREHYTFSGWYTSPTFDAGSRIASFDTSVKASRTYYAKWTELNSFALHYDFGVVTDHIYNPNPERIWADDGVLKLQDVDYAGAAFLGWYDAPTGGKKVTKLSFAKLTKDTTLYARFELPEKTITYAGAGKEYTNSKNNPATYRINPDGANTVLLYAPARTGFIFDGWFLDKDLESGKLSFDGEKNAWILNESENVTLYAKWIRGRWAIRYVLGLEGVSNSGNPEEYTYGTAVELKAPVRTGYTFGGWYTDAAFKTACKRIGETETGEKTLYAKWTAIEYAVAYDLRDPQTAKFFRNSNPATRTVDDEIVLSPLVPTDKRFCFLGWYDNVNYDGKPVEKIAAGTDRDVKLYAKVLQYQWGDVDMDGDVTAADARLVLRCSVDLEDLSDAARAWGDLDHPSTAREITASDARLVLRMSVDLETVEGLRLPALPAGF